MSKDKYKEEEKRIKAELMTKSKETLIELYLQARFEKNFLEAQITAECKEHQEAMQVADKTIKTLKKALELAVGCLRFNLGSYDIEKMCNELLKMPYVFANNDTTNNYFKTKAEEMMKDVKD